MEFLVIALGLLLIYVLTRASLSIFGVSKPKYLPPGPTRLPIIGNLHLLGDQPHQSLAKLASIHGPIMFLKLGRISVLVISSATAAKEVLQKQDLAFSSRHIPDALTAHNHSHYSVVWLPVATKWRSLRRFLNTNIFSGNSLDANQHLRRQKVEELVAYCRKASQSGESVNISRAAFRTTLNLLSNTFFSKDLTDPYEDSGKEFKELVGNMMEEAGKPNLVDYFPVLRKIDPQGIRKRLTHYFGKGFDIFESLIEERSGIDGLNHEDVLNECLKFSEENPDEINRTHIKSLLLAFDIFETLIEERSRINASKQGDVLDECLKYGEENPDEINRTHIKSLLLDLFAAGTDTTSSSLEWAMTEVLRNPHTMTKAKEELREVICKGKMVEESDLLRLPYLGCIVKETLRIHPPVPFLIPRKIQTDVELNGYIIPKGTQVLVNAWAIGRDSAMWEDPLKFNPERFLNSSLDIRGLDFELIPFGAGRRICPGLPLAVRMLPVMLGSLLNNFNWNLDGGLENCVLDMNEKFGITLQKANPLCVVPNIIN